MRKFWFGALVGLLAGALLAAASLGFAAQPIKLVVNSRDVPCDPPPQMIGGRVFVPIRFVAEALGAKVGWDNDTPTVTISFGTDDTIADTKLSSLPVFRLNEPITLDHVQVAITDVRYYDEPVTVETIVFEKRPGMKLAAVTLRVTTLTLPDLPYSKTYSPLSLINRWQLEGEKYRLPTDMFIPGARQDLLPGKTVICTIYFYIYENELLTGVELRDLGSVAPALKVLF